MHQAEYAEVSRLWRGLRSGFDELKLIEPILKWLCIMTMHAVHRHYAEVSKRS
ncbi:MAG: hypothetical protein IJV87_04330 [Clostridia bacterium]|nr:hypothetical protein [Clostridia bacterium]